MIVVFISKGSPELSIQVPYDHEKGQKNNKNEYMVPRNINFMDFRCKLDSKIPKDAYTITVLDAHSGNIKNGGESFERQSIETSALMNIHDGKTYAYMPEGYELTEEDLENFKYLSEINPNMPPNTIKKVSRMVQEIYEKFSVAGIARIDNDTKSKIVYARVIDLLDTLEENGVLNGDTEGEGHSGQSSEED